ncbi:hypothetical protein EDD85DRAFT_795287 [Armillaria nabsnona]|nr:hypothetical protein EDD85DRAFT_795287 [Armillaria nabsnona]
MAVPFMQVVKHRPQSVFLACLPPLIHRHITSSCKLLFSQGNAPQCFQFFDTSAYFLLMEAVSSEVDAPQRAVALLHTFDGLDAMIVVSAYTLWSHRITADFEGWASRRIGRLPPPLHPASSTTRCDGVKTTIPFPNLAMGYRRLEPSDYGWIVGHRLYLFRGEDFYPDTMYRHLLSKVVVSLRWQSSGVPLKISRLLPPIMSFALPRCIDVQQARRWHHQGGSAGAVAMEYRDHKYTSRCTFKLKMPTQ